MKTALLAACLIALQGCTSLSAEINHTSHPLAGYPVGPAYQEDTLNLAQLCAGAEYRHGVRLLWYVENCLGYKLTSGGFVGPDLTYQGSAGVKYNFGRRD